MYMNIRSIHVHAYIQNVRSLRLVYLDHNSLFLHKLTFSINVSSNRYCTLHMFINKNTTVTLQRKKKVFFRQQYIVFATSLTHEISL